MRTMNELPAYVSLTSTEPGPVPEGALRWSGPMDPPAIGTDVIVRINGIGRSKVVAYAEHEGYLGVMTVAYNPPAFLLANFERMGKTRADYEREGALSFGAEIAPAPPSIASIFDPLPGQALIR